MKQVKQQSHVIRQTVQIALLAGAAWTIFLLVSLTTNLRQLELTAIEQAKIEAETLVDMDICFRNWIIGYTGVYALAPETDSADDNTRDRKKDLKTSTGRKLRFFSHAYAMRQLSEAREAKGLPRVHITANVTKNPANSPDDWEREALSGFFIGKREFMFRHDGNNVRYIRAFRKEPACFTCHNVDDGFGGLRGGISATVPLDNYRKAGSKLRASFIAGHSLAWLAGIFAIVFAYRRLTRAQLQLELRLIELKGSMAQVKYLSGLIPICSSCKKLRSDTGTWDSVEKYVVEHSDAKFTRSICPDCGIRIYGKSFNKDHHVKK